MTNPDILEAIYLYGNLGEAVVWFGFAVRFLVKSRRTAARKLHDDPNLDRWTALTFLLFGCSDLVEMRTLAWWRPWWLLFWKASCIIAMLILFLQHYFKRVKF